MTRSFSPDRPSRTALLPVALAAALLAACSGGTGDLPSKPLANDLGDGARIAETIGPAMWLDPGDMSSTSCKSPPDRNVYVTGVTILAIDRYDETGDGQLGNFYVEDASLDPKAYSGATVFAPSFSPPDLRLAVADVADLNGTFQEFQGPSAGKFPFCRTLPELSGTMSFRFEDGPIVPKTIPLSDLKSYATARQWLGMLVRVEGVKIANPPSNSKGRYNADIDVGGGIGASDVPTISNELYDLEGEGPPLAQGTTFKSVTGILTYFYAFHIAPRSAADFEP